MDTFEKQLKNTSKEKIELLLQHLKMGPVHLKKQLTPTQYQKLLKLDPVKDAHTKLKADPLEKFGQLIVTFQSILTGIIGTWFGFAGIVGLRHGDLTTLVPVSCIALFIGILLGYYNYKMKKEEAQTAIEINKILEIDLETVSTLNELLDQEIQVQSDILKKHFLTLYQNQVEKPKQIYEINLGSETDYNVFILLLIKFIHENQKHFKNNELVHKLKRDLASKLKFLQQLASREGEWINNLSKSLKHEDDEGPISKEAQHLSPITVLTNPKYGIPKISTQLPLWLMENKWNFYVSLIPNFLGGFGSMFLFINEVPKLAQEWNILTVYELMTKNYIYISELIVATLVGIFFTLSFFHTKRKIFERQNEIEKKYKEINNIEAITIEKSNRLRFIELLNKNILEIITTNEYLEKSVK